MSPQIDGFFETFRFLSNFWMAPIVVPKLVTSEGDNLLWSSVEHAYQATKTLNLDERETIRQIPKPGKVKRMARKVTLRSDWETIKVSLMETLVRLKFEQNLDIREQLLLTEGFELIEGNTWGDTFWGICNGKGENHLGRILMKVRKELNEA